MYQHIKRLSFTEILYNSNVLIKPAIFLIKFNSGHTTQGSAKFSGKVYFGPSEFPIYYRRY